MTPRAPPASAVAAPIRKPPKAVAKNTAGKYGVKNTSGRICASPQRAPVASTRQQTAKPVLKSAEGWEIPCQPCLNSSINFVIGIITSRDQRIQNKADHSGNREFRPRRLRQGGFASAISLRDARLRCSCQAGILAPTKMAGKQEESMNRLIRAFG